MAVIETNNDHAEVQKIASTFFSRDCLQTGENFFKILDRALGLSVVARPGRESAVAPGAQLPAGRLLGDRDAEFLEDPLRPDRSAASGPRRALPESGHSR
jgi:hypothetical protein